MTAEPNIIQDGEWLIQEDTGEIVGYAEKQAFEVTDVSSAEWVLKKIQGLEAELHSLDATPEVLQAKAVLENAQKMRKAPLRRIEWLLARFTEGLGSVAAKELENARTRTWQTIYGAVALRTVPERLVVKDEAKGLECAAANGWDDMIKRTATFQISKMDKTLVSSILQAREHWNALEQAAFAIEPEHVSVTVKSGVKE